MLTRAVHQVYADAYWWANWRLGGIFEVARLAGVLLPRSGRRRVAPVLHRPLAGAQQRRLRQEGVPNVAARPRVANRPQHSVHVRVDAAACCVADWKAFPSASRYVPGGRVIPPVLCRANGYTANSRLRAPWIVFPSQLCDFKWEDELCRGAHSRFNAVRAWSSHRGCDLFI